MVDDGFIYLRVAENILNGFAWSFNPGEIVNPCSGPLYVAFLVASMFIGLSGEMALLTIYAVGLFISAVILFLALKRYGFVLACAASLISLTNTALITSIGMETSCFIAGIVCTTWAFEQKKYFLAGLGIGLISLLRLGWYPNATHFCFVLNCF